jgi:CPA2 family monovalent cation:H+ antiporter-2
MEHLPGLIADLALILIAGAITTILFRKIKQPLVLGYIIAGFLVGPYISFLPTVQDTANIKTWAEIGVIFLLFSLGLEFSFRKLKRVGGSASVTAVIEIIFITLAGYLLGTWMGWSLMDSVFLGGMLASSSTTIISKAFDELGVKTKKYAGIVIGVLIVEDLVVIMLMVLLSTVAVTKVIEGPQVVLTIVKLVSFLVLWFVAGIFLIPTLLKKAKKLLDEETLLILSIGLCLGMVVLATQVGFSAELGAFIMGSLLAETTSAEKIEHLIKPVKDLFAAVFFISVGMLIDPATIVEYRWPILWITLLVLVGKLFSTSAGALLSGQPLKQSVQVGMSMAQVGEFAFIVASLGLSLGVTSEFLFPVAVGVSAITTFTTPYMIKLSPGLNNFLERVIPGRILMAINNYSSDAQGIQTESTWKRVMNGYLSIVVTNGIIILAIFFISIQFFLPFVQGYFEDPFSARLIVLAVTLGITAPFLYALMAKRLDKEVYNELWIEKKYNRGPILLLEIARVVIAILLTGFLLDRLYSSSVAVMVALPVIFAGIILFSKRTKNFYHLLEERFLGNLNERETNEKVSSFARDFLNKQLRSQPDLLPWDVHLTDMQVSQSAGFIGKSLSELAWREKYGINVACIKRGERLIFAPGKDTRLFPLDHLGIIGTDEQMIVFKPVFENPDKSGTEDYNMEDITVQRIIINDQNRLSGKSIRASGIKERSKGLVIGIERNNKRMVNPPSDTVFEPGDIIWVTGEREMIQRLSEEEEK